MTFEEKTKRIDEIATLLDSGKLGLEESLKLYEEGVLLSKECMESLDNAKGKIMQIKKDAEGNATEEEMQ